MVPGSRLDEAAEPQRALCLGFIFRKGRQGEGKWCRAVAWTKRRSRNALCASASFSEKTTGRREMVPGSRLDEAAEPQRALCLGIIFRKDDRAKENGAGQSLGRSGGAATRFVPRHHFSKRATGRRKMVPGSRLDEAAEPQRALCLGIIFQKGRQGEGKWCRAVAWTKRRSRNALCASASFSGKTTGRRKMVPGSRLDEAAEPQRALCLGIIFQKGRQGEGKWCRAVAWTKRRSRNALCASASFSEKTTGRRPSYYEKARSRVNRSPGTSLFKFHYVW